MWYLYLKDSSLSSETVNICIKNKVHTMQDLLDLYREKKKFNNLKDINSDQEDELLTFCSETLQYFNTYIDGSVKQGPEHPADDKNQKMENTTIFKLYNMGLVSKQLYHAMLYNNIDDLIAMKQHYREYKNFLSLRNIGDLKNDEAIEFIETITIEGFESTFSPTEIPDELLIPASQIDMVILENLLRMRSDLLKDAIVSYFEKEILPEADMDQVAEKLHDLYQNRDMIRGVGRSRAAILKNFLIEYKEICGEPKKKKLFEKEYILFRCRLFIREGYNCNEIEELHIDRPFQIIDFIIQHSKKFKPRDLYILENIKAAKIYTHSLNLKFIEALDDLSDIHGKKMSLSSTKTLNFRIKESLQELLDNIMEEIPELKEKIKAIIPFGQTQLFIDAQILRDLNEKNHTQFNLSFFDTLFTTIHKDYLSLYNLGNRGFDFLYFIERNQVKNEAGIKAFATVLKDILKRDSPNPFPIDMDELIPDGMLNMERDAFLTGLLKDIHPDIKMEGRSIVFPATREGKLKVIDMIVPLLKEHGEAMHYDSIIVAFDKKYPDIERTSYRSLRDALDGSDLTLSLGGLSNHFILAEWTDKYHIGSVKNLIFDYLEPVSTPVHHYEIYCELKPGRPGLSQHNVLQTLSHLSGKVFKSHNEGFFSLKKREIEATETYTRLNKAIYNFIRENGDLLESPELLLEKMMLKFPMYKKIQLEYALEKYKNDEV